MKRFLLILTVVLALVPVVRAQDAARLYKTAMNTEMVDGDLKAAIEQYEKVVAANDRALAAQALLRMAECYQKLGAAEATSVYERIVRDFGDQTATAALAKARLSIGTARSASTGLTTQVVSGGGDDVSLDGMHFSTNVNDQKGDQSLGLRDVATGAIRSLQVIKPTDIESYPLRSAFSADGRQLAVEWYFDSDYRGRLWTVATAGTSPVRPRVLVDNPEIAAISPFDWSRDSRWIAVQVKRKDLGAQIGLVSVEDGSLRVLRSLDWIGATQMAFSRDGKFLAYDRPSAEGDIERDVFAIAVDGTREVPVVVHPGDDRLVGWSPDGQRLLFSSNRGGTVGLWAVTFTAESLPPTAEFLSEFGNSRAIGLTDSGTLYYKTLHGGADVFVAPFDAGSKQTSSAPARAIRQFSGLNQMPEWSADGKYLAYVSKRDPVVPSPVTIVISSSETGAVVRELRPKLSYLAYPRWSPDGRTFVARGADMKGRSGIVKFDATTGDASLVVPNEVCSGIPSWTAAPNGSFFCFDFEGKRILQVDAESGAVRRAIPSSWQAAAVSPDGQSPGHR